MATHSTIRTFHTRKLHNFRFVSSTLMLGVGVNPQAPVADEVVFRRFQGHGVEFFFKSALAELVMSQRSSAIFCATGT